MSRLRTEYIDTGKVRFVYKQFAILGPESTRTAEASECAAEQGKFWEYHDQIFANQRKLSDEDLKTYATNIGLNMETFDACYASGKFKADVVKDMREGGKIGVTGTPAFFVNGRFLSGAQPFEKFKPIIDEELAK